MRSFAEPKITINGRELSEGQAMVIRVACTSFSAELQNKSVRDILGQIGIAYQQRLDEILSMLLE